MKFIDLFSGVGGFTRGLEFAGHEGIGHCELDKFAEASYRSMHTITEEQRKYLLSLPLKQRQKEILKEEYLNGEWYERDIKRARNIPRADMWTFGFPCQDISVAGKGAGIIKGVTRSGLLREVERLLLESQKSDELPKYLIMENVKNLVSKRFIADFERWLEFLEGLGYTNHWQVLNSKDYGIPQNRERVFCISILGDEEFMFPRKQPLIIRLKDFLEYEVDEKYYLSQKQIHRIKFSTFKMGKQRLQEKDYCDTLCTGDHKRPKCIQIGQYDRPRRKNSNRYRVYDDEGISPTIQTYQGGNRQPSIRIKNGTKKGFLEAADGDDIDLAFPESKQRRGRVQKQIVNTLDTSSNKGVAIYSPTVCIGSTQKNASVTDGSYSPTLTSSMGTGGGHVPMIDIESPAISPKVIGGIGEKTSNNGKQYFYQNRIYDTGVATAVATSLQPNYLDSAFRVRKLTPKECFRLQGWEDEYFERAEQFNSNSQLYKQAGNGVTVDVVKAIGEKLREQENEKAES